MELPKPLPKEKTPEPLVIPAREKTEPAVKPSNLPNDDEKNRPMPRAEHVEKTEVENSPEPNDDEKNTPMDTEAHEETHEEKAPVDPSIKAAIAEETKDASAIADAIIMSHTAATKTSSKHKSNVATFIVLILGVLAVLAVLFFGGVIKIGGGGSGDEPAPLDDPRGPRLAKKVCEAHENYQFEKLTNQDDWYIMGNENADASVRNQYTCKYKEDMERPEETFEFTFVVLNENYEDIEGFKDYLSSTSEYYTILEDSDEFFKCLTSTNPHIYLSVYKTSFIHLYASDVDTAEKLLKDLKFPDRAHAEN